jgi:hypothetical protein
VSTIKGPGDDIIGKLIPDPEEIIKKSNGGCSLEVHCTLHMNALPSDEQPQLQWTDTTQRRKW